MNAALDSPPTTEAKPKPRDEGVDKFEHVVLVTGGQGFIGARFIRHLIDKFDNEVLILNYDANEYAAAEGTRFASNIIDRGDNAFRLELDRRYGPTYEPGMLDVIDDDLNGARGVGNSNHIWFESDIVNINSRLNAEFVDRWRPTHIVHLAAESHVDRSIDGSAKFMQTNIEGTRQMLEFARKCDRLEKFVYVSTDEVYGDWGRAWSCNRDMGHDRGFLENARLSPRNPYAASKAAAEHLCQAYRNTYDVPITITRGCNTFGFHQFPEKFIPVVCDNAFHDRPIPVYGDGQQKRQWMHVEDHVSGICAAMLEGRPGQVYNLGHNQPEANMWIVEVILDALGKPRSLIEHVQDRPGHDRFYWINSEKARAALGWEPRGTVTVADPTQIAGLAKWYASPEAQAWMRYTGHRTEQRLGCSKESS